MSGLFLMLSLVSTVTGVYFSQVSLSGEDSDKNMSTNTTTVFGQLVSTLAKKGRRFVDLRVLTN